ncbi:hypothetical protein [Neisseria wadsworthii]|uniref:DUF4145 domain-containing protein n=1 Tax=Neisseria wadsworthii 9715 TaxID=1030841 RepID=G4CSV2_9NEIS|nr:hypothetical protein [Neisseria wadsworthii]EGZ44567.1 hypothetical protein HMPREF9370_2093 [Neisseria wadsworthii 9715]QMT35712.1 hypothetical protein H3L96_00045 [Neisseria wadsworthii]
MTILPERYEDISKEILSDIFYLKGLSNRGRVTLIRQYAEILCRVLLKIDDHFYLGKFEQRLKKEIPEAILVADINCHVRNLTKLGNSATHLDKELKVVITDKDCESALNSLNFLISYLFIDYFRRYKFGIRSEAQRIISLLPPFIRVVILQGLYKEYGNNIAVIDKLFLAILKSEGENNAIKWVEEEKSNLMKLSCIEDGALDAYREQGIPEVVIQQIIFNAPQNMYEHCLQKLEEMKLAFPDLKFPYKTFEEAKAAYFFIIENEMKNCNSEIMELISLMDFIYIGRNID